MNIVILIDRYNPILGGAQNNVHEMGRRLSSQGFKVTVFTRSIYKELSKFELIDGVMVKRFGYFPIRIVSKLLCFASMIYQLIRRRKDYDLVLSVPCVELTDLLPAYFASFITKKPFVIRMTGFPTFYERTAIQNKLSGSSVRNFLTPDFIWRSAIKRASAVVALSKVLYVITNEYDVARCDVIPNGVDSNRFRAASGEEKLKLRRQLGLPEDKIVLINTGRYDYEKNQITLIKAAEQIECILRTGKIYVVILGATQRNQVTSNEEEIKQYVEKQGIASLIRFIDDATNVEEYLRASDIFVHPTTDEGMSNALIEAMASGLPIICSNIPQETCLFPDKKGYFFPPEDVEILVEHLIAFIDSSELRKTYGTTLSEYASRNYINEYLVKRYAALFSDVVHEQPVKTSE